MVKIDNVALLSEDLKDVNSQVKKKKHPDLMVLLIEIKIIFTMTLKLKVQSKELHQLTIISFLNNYFLISKLVVCVFLS